MQDSQDSAFPLEVFENIIDHVEANRTQATLCRVSHSFCSLARPRLYHSYDSLTILKTETHAAYLRSIIEYEHVAKLVRSFSFISQPGVAWPRHLYIALPRMSGLKNLSLINVFQTDHPNHLDLWRYFFQNDKIPFRLTSFQLLWVGPAAHRPFESMMLCTFLKQQKTLRTLVLSYHTALIHSNDLPRLQHVTIDWDNWAYVVPGRPIKTLHFGGSLADAGDRLKPITPGSPMEITLRSLKLLRVDAQVMNALLLHLHLPSLEVLVVSAFKDGYRQSLSLLPRLKVLCILHSRNPERKQKDTATWFFANMRTITDVIYSGTIGRNGEPKNSCQRYRRNTPAPQNMPSMNAYLDIAKVA